MAFVAQICGCEDCTRHACHGSEPPTFVLGENSRRLRESRPAGESPARGGREPRSPDHVLFTKRKTESGAVQLLSVQSWQGWALVKVHFVGQKQGYFLPTKTLTPFRSRAPKPSESDCWCRERARGPRSSTLAAHPRPRPAGVWGLPTACGRLGLCLSC